MRGIPVRLNVTAGSDAGAARGAQRVGAFRVLPELLREFGVDPELVLADAGLDAEALNDPKEVIPYAAVGRLLHSAVARTNCSHFGLLVGRSWHLTDLGVVGEVMRNSPTVGDALRALVHFQIINCGGAVPFVRRADRSADFGCAIYESGMPSVDQATDMYVATGVNFLRELCGPDWSPSEIFLPYSRPENIEQQRHFFRVQPHFDAEVCAIRFAAEWLRAPIEGADPHRLRAATAEATAQLTPDILQAVRRSLRLLMLDGRNSGDDVAKMLNLHRRTLNRRLKDAGTTFQAQLDLVRFEAARQLLASSAVTLDDLAALLGYSGISPFMRSCKRWVGATPTQWRRVARNDELFLATRAKSVDAEPGRKAIST